MILNKTLIELFKDLKKELDEILGLDDIHEQKFSLAYYPAFLKFYELIYGNPMD